jgi:hypothetical protein
MTLIEILAQPWNQYRQGIIFSIQKGDFDAAIAMLQGMGMVLPEVYRPEFDPIPVADNLQADLMLKTLKWTWVTESLKRTEDAISRWIHDNFDKVAMGV